MANGQNTGSFGSPIGDVSALKQAMERRGMDSSILDQVSSAAPGPQTPVAPNIPDTNPQVGAVAQEPTPPPQQQEPQAPPPRSGEMEIALNALKDVVKTESDIAEAKVKLGGL